MPITFEEARSAGLSTRTSNALSRLDGLSLADVLELPWGDPQKVSTLAWRLRILPGMGPIGLSEVAAWRARH